jgi:hypothetical protein
MGACSADDEATPLLLRVWQYFSIDRTVRSSPARDCRSEFNIDRTVRSCMPSGAALLSLFRWPSPGSKALAAHKRNFRMLRIICALTLGMAGGYAVHSMFAVMGWH